MSKTEFKIGEVIKLGLMMIRVEKMDDNKGCRECFLYYFCCDCAEEFRYAMVGACDSRERKDGTDVIFKEVEEKGNDKTKSNGRKQSVNKRRATPAVAHSRSDFEGKF